MCHIMYLMTTLYCFEVGVFFETQCRTLTTNHKQARLSNWLQSRISRTQHFLNQKHQTQIGIEWCHFHWPCIYLTRDSKSQCVLCCSRATTSNKLHNIYPTLPINSNYPKAQLTRQEQTLYNRLRIGHTYLTHSYLLKDEDPPICIPCKFSVNCRAYPH